MRIGVDITNLASGAVSGVEQYTLQILKELIRQNPQDQFVLFAIDYYFRSFGDRLDKILRGPGKFLLEAPNVTLKKLPWPKIPLSLHLFWKVFDWPKADLFLNRQLCRPEFSSGSQRAIKMLRAKRSFGFAQDGHQGSAQRDIGCQVDVFFQPSPMLLPLSRRTPRVVTFHDLVPAIYPEYFTLTSRLWHWQMNYPVRAREADKIIAVSENTRNDLIRLYGIDPEKIEVIYEGADEVFHREFSETELATVREKYQLPEQFLFYVGSLEPRKNVISIVRALQYLRERGFAKMKLVLAGSKKWLAGELRDEIEKLGLGEAVLFLGYVAEEEKAALFKLASVFVFPSLYEGFGLPVLEALSVGCPTVASQNSSLPEITWDAALLVDPFDQASINQAVCRAVSQSDLRAALKEKGRRRAEAFSWEKAARKTKEVLEAIARRRAGGNDEQVLLH